ncbi:MAG: hypothetical protein H0V66_06985 [Bdellovibrionales bacterium]|nr:hypothetical protein [Bdellovibrionales bacterium]
MKTLKALVLFCLTILSQVVFAGEWNHVEVNKDGYYLKASYTKQWVTPTYGTNGGMMTGKIFVDLYSVQDAAADKIEIFETYNNGSMTKLIVRDFNEAKATHHWAQLDKEPSYAGVLSIGVSYLVRVHVDGKIVQLKLKLN